MEHGLFDHARELGRLLLGDLRGLHAPRDAVQAEALQIMALAVTLESRLRLDDDLEPDLDRGERRKRLKQDIEELQERVRQLRQRLAR